MNRYLLKERRFSLAQRRALRCVVVRGEVVVSKLLVKHLGGLEVKDGVMGGLDPRNSRRVGIWEGEDFGGGIDWL